MLAETRTRLSPSRQGWLMAARIRGRHGCDVARRGDVREEEQELVGRRARHGVAVAHEPGDPPADTEQQFVPAGMAQRVVHSLEPVEVEDPDDEAGLPPLRGGDGLAEPVSEQGAVGQAGQRVSVGELLDERLGLLAVGEVGDHPDTADDLVLGPAQRRGGETHPERLAARPCPRSLV